MVLLLDAQTISLYLKSNLIYILYILYVTIHYLLYVWLKYKKLKEIFNFKVFKILLKNMFHTIVLHMIFCFSSQNLFIKH